MKTWICSTLLNIYNPMQGSARVYAYLKREKYDIALKDFNQDTYFALFSRKNLEQVLEKLHHDIDTHSNELRERLGLTLQKSSDGNISQLLRKIVGNNLNNEDILDTLFDAGDFIIDEIDKSCRILDKDFFSLPPDELLSNYRILQCGKAIIDTAYYPAKLDALFGFSGTAYSTSASDIIRATSDHDHNFTIPYFRNVVIPQFIQEQPSVVGISITLPAELIPALTLARMIKNTDPTTHICLGGAALTELAYRIANNTGLWDLFDSLIMGPGESAFGELIDHLESGKELSGVPHIFYKKGVSIEKSEKTREFDMNDACTPDYGFVRPGSTLPLETASACYWGKCIFCRFPEYGTVSGDIAYNRKRVRNIELVLQDIDLLMQKYNPITIAFTDSAMHPKRMESIVDHNNGNKKKFKFTAYVRLEKQREFRSSDFCQKMADGGFIHARIGLESGSQRINNIINKGVDLAEGEEIIKNLHHAGVLIHLFSIVGTPGETREDALMTYDFIKRRHEELLSWEIFNLQVFEHSPLHERSQEFEMTAVPLPEEYLDTAMKYSVAEGLSQKESLKLALRFTNHLAQYINPLPDTNKEWYIAYLLQQKAKDISPEESKDIYVRTVSIPDETGGY